MQRKYILWFRVSAVLCAFCFLIALCSGCGGGWTTVVQQLLGTGDPLLTKAEQTLQGIPEECRDLVAVERHDLAGRDFTDYLMGKLRTINEEHQLLSTPEIVCYVDSLAMGTWVVLVEVSDLSVTTVANRYLYVSPAAPEEERAVYEIASPMPESYWNIYLCSLFTEEPVSLNGETIESVLFEPLFYTKGSKEANEEYGVSCWLDERIPDNVRFMAVFPVGTFQVDEVEFPESARGEGPILRRFPRGDAGNIHYRVVEEALQVCEGQLLPDMDMTSMSEKEIADLVTEGDLTLEDYQVYRYVDYPYIAGTMDADEAGAIPFRTLARGSMEKGILTRMEFIDEEETRSRSLTQTSYFAWQGREYQINFWGLGDDYQASMHGLSQQKGSGYESYYRYSSGMLWRLAEALGYDLSAPVCSLERLAGGGTLWRDEADNHYTYCMDIGAGETFLIDINRTLDYLYEIAVYKMGESMPICEYFVKTSLDDLPFLEDLNGDGYLDLTIRRDELAGNSLWCHYLWSPTEQTYVEAPGLLNRFWKNYHVSGDDRRIALQYWTSQNEWYMEVYQWDEDLEPAWVGSYVFHRVDDDNMRITVNALPEDDEQAATKRVVTDAVYDYWDYRYNRDNLYGTDVLLDWAEAKILWYTDVEERGQTYSLYYAQDILRNEAGEISGYRGRVWIADDEKRFVSYKEFPSDAPCSNIQWIQSDQRQGMVITFEDGSRQEHSLTELLIREYVDWGDIMHDASQPYVDREIFAIIRAAYAEVDYSGEFKTGDLESYDFYIEKFNRLLKNEVFFWEPESGKTYYMEEYNDTWRFLDMRPELREIFDVNNFIYYFFDMDDDGAPELGVREAGLGAYVLCFFKYDKEKDEYSLWYSYDSASWYDLLGTRKVAWNHDGNKFAYYQLDETGREDQPECHTFFFEGYVSEEKTVRMVGLPQYADKSKEIEVTEEMMRQGSYARYSDEWFFRVTEEQFDAIAKPYWEANRLANEKEKDCLYTYEELFGGSRP